MTELLWAAALGVGVFIVASYCMAFPVSPQGISSFWLTNGVPLAALLRTPRRRWPLLIAAGFAGNLAAVMFSEHTGVYVGSIRSVANVAQYTFCAYFTRKKFGIYTDITNFREIVFLMNCGLISTIFKILFIVSVYSVVRPDVIFDPPFCTLWVLTNFFGLFVLLLPILAITAKDQVLPKRIDLAGYANIAGIILCMYYVFGPPAWPFGFAILPFLMLLGWRQGMFGAGVGSLLVIAVAMAFAYTGDGITGMLGKVGYVAAIRGPYLELFFIVALLSCLPLSIARERQVITDLALAEALDASQQRAQLLATSEASYQIAEKRWRAALESSGLGVWDYDLQKHEIYVSRIGQAIAGFDEGEIETAADRWMNLIHPDDLTKIFAIANDWRNHETASFNLEQRLLCKDGRQKWVLLHGSVLERANDGSPSRIIGTMQDIDSIRQAKRSAERRSNLYRTLAACNAAIARRDSIEDLIDALCQVLVNECQMKLVWVGFGDDQTGRIEPRHVYGTGTEYLDGIVIGFRPGDPDGAGPSGTAFRTNAAVWIDDFATDPKTARWRDRSAPFGWRGSAAIPLRLKGQVIAVLTMYTEEVNYFDEDARTILTEISAQISLALDTLDAEASARKASDRLRNIIETSEDVICTIDRDGRFLEVSGNCEKIWGWTRLQMLGQKCTDFMLPRDRELAMRSLNLRIAGTPVNASLNSFVRPDGSLVPMSWSATWIEDEQVCHCIGRDMTRFNALEAQVQLAQRMDAIGQLTGGVAHDFNNLLTIVIGGSEMLVEQLRDPEQRELAEFILQAAEQGGELTRQLLAFARRQPLEPHPFDVNRLLDTMIRLIAKTHGEDIALSIEQHTELNYAYADPTQTEAAILNLCLNARDAMPHGGTLTIRTRNVTFDEAYVADHPEVREGNYVAISVRDTGTGIAPDVVERIFEPFFTTKDVGKGSGMGLSMVYGFIKQSEGFLDLETELGQGTTFTMYLPAADRDAHVIPIANPQGDELIGGNEKVLIVEDNDLVRQNARLMFESLGYSVAMAANGTEAMTKLETDPDIDLLFTDVVMPGGMNGPELAEAAIALRPNLRILFTSGYSQGALTEKGRLLDNVSLLTKPFSKRQLSEKARHALDEVL